MPRVATIGCGMLITIFFMFCIFQNVFSASLGHGSNHHHSNSRYSIERRSIDSRKENTVASTEGGDVMVPVSAESAKQVQEQEVPEASTELPFPSIPFAARLPQPAAASTPNVNLFEEYMSRGLYTCTSSYLDALGKLHALIAEVYADYQNCQKLIKTTPKTFSRTDIDALDDMLDEWEKEDAAAASTAQKPVQQQSQEASERSQESIPAAVIPDPSYPPPSSQALP